MNSSSLTYALSRRILFDINKDKKDTQSIR